MAKTRLRLAALAGVLALAAGCDKTKMPQTYPVTGTVAFADGEPIKGGDRGGAVEFQSATDPELRISGQIKEDGTFALQTLKDKTKVEGAPEGSYTVTFLPPKREDGRLLLPQPVKLPQTFQVEAKENHFDIKIDRPADF